MGHERDSFLAASLKAKGVGRLQWRFDDNETAMTCEEKKPVSLQC